MSIAEEAHDSKKRGLEIINHITAQPIKYAVLDDYTQNVNIDSPRAGAFLNDDTCVRSLIVDRMLGPYSFVVKCGYFDIIEDMCVAETSTEECKVDVDLDPEQVSLLHSPLPQDLPRVDKDLLILMAAYDGNTDRYTRLRRPVMIESEEDCVVRGIHHCTMFAKWWDQQLKPTGKKNQIGRT